MPMHYFVITDGKSFNLPNGKAWTQKSLLAVQANSFPDASEIIEAAFGTDCWQKAYDQVSVESLLEANTNITDIWTDGIVEYTES